MLFVNSDVLKVALALLKGLVMVCAFRLPLGLLRALFHMDQVVSIGVVLAVLDVLIVGDGRADESAHPVSH